MIQVDKWHLYFAGFVAGWGYWCVGGVGKGGRRISGVRYWGGWVPLWERWCMRVFENEHDMVGREGSKSGGDLGGEGYKALRLQVRCSDGAGKIQVRGI